MNRSALALIFLFGSQLVFGSTDDFDTAVVQGAAYLRQGQYHLALETLETAQQIAVGPAQQAEARGWLGLAHYRMHHPEQADALLQNAIAPGVGDAHDRARWTAALADLRADHQRPEEARRLYAKALKLAGGDRRLVVGIRLGQAGLMPPDQRLAELRDIGKSLLKTDRPEDRARYLVNIGTQAGSLGKGGEKLAYDSFEQARWISDAEPRVQSEALGGLAQLYEDRKRVDEALRLNREAMQVAESIDARDLLLELEWRAGRLYRTLQQSSDALAAYQRAVEHIEAIRQDIPVEYHEGRSSFRETLEPVYLALADLLLEQANRRTGDDKTALLRQARQTVELIKQSELEDFLGSRCTVQSAKKTLLETRDPRAAILYPIILPGRLELLISVGSELRHYTQTVDQDTVQETARELAKILRDHKLVAESLSQAQSLSRQLYLWLIAPAEPWLRQYQVQTLVIVPDGVLRLIPLGALYDGEHYLIERYAIATSPGLTLFEASPLQQHGITALLAGMSEAGPVVENLPRVFFHNMIGTSSKGRGGEIAAQPTPPNSLTEASEAPAGNQDTEVERLLHDPDFHRSLKERLVLPGVDREIDSLRQEVTNKVLMNKGFTVDNFKQEIVRNAYSVVHIASHGVFGHTADTTFIMAYDGIINIDELEQLFKSEKFQKAPVELLTLSACQTAEGDDRAPLGLSGIALKAKVRSALGTLWPVSDEAASKLMADFYQALSQPGTSKVQALRRAQQAMIENPRFAHPFFWSPFILVGNWL